MAMASVEHFIFPFGRTKRVQRCRAKSKRSGNQCLKAAMNGKAVCLAHGGRSTGPKTAAGRAKCAEVKTMHGREGRQTREVRAKKLLELRELDRYIKGSNNK